MIESLGTLFLPHLGGAFPLSEPLNQWWGERVETIQIRKEHKGFEKISKRSKGGWQLILISRRDHVIAHLSGQPLVAIRSSMPTAPQQWQKCCFFCFGFWEFPFLVLRFLASFLSCLGGAPKIDLALSKFSLANSFLTTLFSISILLAGGTKTVVLVETILGEEKSYPKPIWSKANFWRLSISSSLTLEVLFSWALTWKNSTSGFLFFSAKKLFSNLSAPIV